MSLQDVGKTKDTTVVTLRHPDPRKTLKNPDGSDMTVVLHGPYSKRYKTAQRTQQQQRMEQMAETGASATLTIDEIDDMTREILTECIESWTIWETPEVQMACTPENIERLFDEHPWALDQLSNALGRSASFLDAPKPL